MYIILTSFPTDKIEQIVFIFYFILFYHEDRTTVHTHKRQVDFRWCDISSGVRHQENIRIAK